MQESKYDEHRGFNRNRNNNIMLNIYVCATERTHFITCIPVYNVEIVAKICRKTWIFIHYASLRWVNTFQHWCYRASAICRFIYFSIAATNVNTILQIFDGAACAQTNNRPRYYIIMHCWKQKAAIKHLVEAVCTKQSTYNMCIVHRKYAHFSCSKCFLSSFH